MKKLLVMLCLGLGSVIIAEPVNEHVVQVNAPCNLHLQIPEGSDKYTPGYFHLPPVDTNILSPRTAPVKPVGMVQNKAPKPSSIVAYLALFITLVKS